MLDSRTAPSANREGNIDLFRPRFGLGRRSESLHRERDSSVADNSAAGASQASGGGLFVVENLTLTASTILDNHNDGTCADCPAASPG